MKKILASLIALYLLVPSTFAQDDEIRPMGLGISFFLNDFATASNIRSSSLNAVIRDKTWAKFKQMSPGIGISYFKGLTSHIDFAATVGGSFTSYKFANGNQPSATDHFLLEANTVLQFKLVTDKYWVQPYAIAGVGAHRYMKYYGAYIPLGIGFKINFFDEVQLFVNSQYRVPVLLNTGNYHFQHSIGVASPLGKKKVKVIPPPAPVDTDGDGITDDKDKCPTVPGLAKYDGCPIPDTDGDGINDEVDKCPTVKGLAKYNGCPIPDTDGDGINDEEDQCPTVKGLARYHGCPIPDTDKDGINDEEDKCPTVPGLARYQGCPIPDRDKDGVNDEEDKCPDLFGVKENDGCPLITEEIKKTVGFAAKNILFVTGSYRLVSSSYKGLNDVIAIMKKDANIKLYIDGHTDNVGKADYNQTLSENRANAVKQYFISKGIAESRITSAGHGMDVPIADNKTAAGRQKNRRVEMKLNYY